MITLDNISINSVFKSVKIYERKESKILVGIEVKQKEKLGKIICSLHDRISISIN